jgi:hypothetical protein
VQSLVPLVVGIPLAGGAGLPAGAVYLMLAEERGGTPWQAVAALSAGAYIRLRSTA